jgi:glycosyltransferase involved in cell wall biosynthesis
MPDESLRILLTDPHLKGGGQVRYVTQLARELTRQGHRVCVGCKPASVLVNAAKEAGAHVFARFHFRGGLRPRSWLCDLATIRRFILAERPEILHANGSQDHWVLGLGNYSLGMPVCLVRTRHNTYAVGDNVANRMLNLRWTDYQIAVCEAVRQMRVTRPTFDSSRMDTIHNGVDPDQFYRDPARRAEARREFGFDEKDVVIGMAARLALAKGHKFLFEATAGLRREFPRLRLLILGQGVLDDELKQLARDRDIASITTFAGFRDDIGRCIQAFDVGAVPSIDCEASSFSVMEQMATEVPIVTSDHGGTREIVRDGVDGYVVPQGTVAPLAEALRRLLADPALRRTMGQSARERVLREFTLDLLAKRTVEAYHHALALHRERAHR